MIDAHHHLWEYSPEEYPWIPPGSPLAKDYLLPELEQACQSAGVDGSIVVQARQTLGETDWLLTLASESPRILGVVGWLPLASKDIDTHISRFAAMPKFKAVRHVLQDEPDSFFLDPAFQHGLGRLAVHSVPYDLLIYQRQLPVAIQCVDQQPELNFVIDHIAKPEIYNGRIEKAWLDGMQELAARDNVLGVKLSGMANEVRNSEIDQPSLHAYLEETLKLFGPQRLLFGTDWPVCLLRLDSYKSWVDTIQQFTNQLSTDEAKAILHNNASRIYQLDDA